MWQGLFSWYRTLRFSKAYPFFSKLLPKGGSSFFYTQLNYGFNFGKSCQVLLNESSDLPGG